jgi:nucleoside-diphosphate-sugar epimerase
LSGPLQPLDPAISAALAGRCILVTGGSGFIASAILARLREVRCRVRRLVRPSRGTFEGGGLAEITDLEADVQAEDVWAAALAGVDLVLHLAAQTSSSVADADPASDLEANVRPLLRLLEHCRRGGLRPGVVFASAATVVGRCERLPVDESPPDDPLTAYDVHKLMAETYLRWYTRRGIVRGASLRLTNVYGPGPESRRPDRSILDRTIARALAGEALTVHRPTDRVRDYLYVDDAALGFLAAAANLTRLDGRHFVVGSGRGTTLREAWDLVAGTVARTTGRRVEVLETDPPFPPSPIEARHFVADPRRFSDLTGWRPRVALPEGIARAVESRRGAGEHPRGSRP